MITMPLVTPDNIGLIFISEDGFEYKIESINENEPDLYVTHSTDPYWEGSDCRWSLSLVNEYLAKGKGFRRG